MCPVAEKMIALLADLASAANDAAIAAADGDTKTMQANLNIHEVQRLRIIRLIRWADQHRTIA